MLSQTFASSYKVFFYSERNRNVTLMFFIRIRRSGLRSKKLVPRMIHCPGGTLPPAKIVQVGKRAKVAVEWVLKRVSFDRQTRIKSEISRIHQFANSKWSEISFCMKQYSIPLNTCFGITPNRLFCLSCVANWDIDLISQSGMTTSKSFVRADRSLPVAIISF